MSRDADVFEPVRSSFLPYAAHGVEEEDVAAVTGVLRSDRLTCGPEVERFEEAMAAATGAKYAVSFSSGTAALHGAAFAAGLGPGDEAITTPLTFCATANSVLYTGATPIFADVDEETLNVGAESFPEKITPRTKALIPVDYAGHPADLTPIIELARARGLTVIEDGCHALGARYRGRPVGSVSDITIFSFHPAKHVTCGEGGMAVTDDPELAEKMRRFRNHCIDTDAAERARAISWSYDVTGLGHNYRLSDMAAALGLSQLRRLGANLTRRRDLAAFYSEQLGGTEALKLPAEREWAESAWHLYPVRVRQNISPVTRDEVQQRLHKMNIGTGVHYPPVHLHTLYRERLGHRPGDFPVAERAAGELISLPMFHSMTEADAADVVRALRLALEP